MAQPERPMNMPAAQVIQPADAADRALLARIAAGDSQALTELYARQAAVVYGLALRILAQSDLAEEVVQETFWRVWRRSETFKGERGTVMAWVLGIAHNLSIDELRRQRTRPIASGDTSERALLNIADGRSNPVDMVLANEQRQLIQEALAHLSAEQREAIELAFFGGLSQSEIASTLNSPLGTIKARVRLGMQRLRDYLNTKQVGGEDTAD